MMRAIQQHPTLFPDYQKQSPHLLWLTLSEGHDQTHGRLPRPIQYKVTDTNYNLVTLLLMAEDLCMHLSPTRVSN